MTVNKSQGQSLHCVGIFCSRDFFSHGQFYVAASRVGRSSRLRILAQDEQTKKKRRFLSNVVYEEVLNVCTLKHLQLHFLLKRRALSCVKSFNFCTHECTRDQYPFNGQMCTGTALVSVNARRALTAFQQVIMTVDTHEAKTKFTCAGFGISFRYIYFHNFL